MSVPVQVFGRRRTQDHPRAREAGVRGGMRAGSATRARGPAYPSLSVRLPPRQSSPGATRAATVIGL